MNKKVKKNFKKLNGSIIIPPDKSISHRAILFATMAKGKSIIKNFSKGADPHSSLEICKNLGAEISFDNSTIQVVSDGILNPCAKSFDCGNSGTTMRLLSGILAGQNFNSILMGDSSLSTRPMKRIIEPLQMMGANIKSNNNCAPLEIYGQNLHSINYSSKIASAQVKSCVLLAGMQAEGLTSYKEIYPSRNHTEIMLSYMGADIKTENDIIYIQKSELSPLNIEICGDISSAAYFIVAALIVPNSQVIIKNVGLNPTRTGIIDVVKQMNGNLEILDRKEICGEVVGDIKVSYTENLKSCEISGGLIPKLIDEIPVIAVLATQANGKTVIKDAQDLRNKESDRINNIVTELNKLGANIDQTKDGMIIYGKTPLKGDVISQSYKDHRIAMSLYIAGLIAKDEISIDDFEWVNISFPEFENLISILCK